MVDYLSYDLFYPTSNPVKCMVVSAFEREAALGAAASGTCRQITVEDAAQFVLLVLGEAVVAPVVRRISQNNFLRMECDIASLHRLVPDLAVVHGACMGKRGVNNLSFQ